MYVPLFMCHPVYLITSITLIADWAYTECRVVSSVHEPEVGNGQSERTSAVEWAPTVAWNVGLKRR